MKNSRRNLSPGTLLAPVPPALVTVGDFDNANIITIAWTGILNSVPPKTYISVRPSRHSYGILKEKGEFVINLPSVSLAKETDYVGIYTGAKVDKWEKTGLTKAKSEKISPPTIAECPVAVECRVCEVIPMGSHDVFMADIVSVSCREDIIDENGKMHFDRADLLAYAHGEYYGLGDVVGRFGFSTDKPQKAEETPKKPFYENAPRGKSSKRKPTDKNKGAPHGRKGAAKK
jgi:flavin reductase (DIM6/NTAB) family NADH-FMN oxidoreductase RutF